VAHVPSPSFRFRALIRQDELIASGAARLERLGVMPTAIEAPVPVKVDQVHEEFPADGAGKAARMPSTIWAGTRGQYGHISTAYAIRTLFLNLKI